MDRRAESVVCGHHEIKHLMLDHSHPFHARKQTNERNNEEKNLYEIGVHCTDSFQYNLNLISHHLAKANANRKRNKKN